MSDNQRLREWTEQGWAPHRNELQEVSGWVVFVQRIGLELVEVPIPGTPLTTKKLRGQDGWAFDVAIRFQALAHKLADEDEEVYWSGYALLAAIIQKTRCDLQLLDAVEALAIVYMSNGITDASATLQLERMGLWPVSPRGAAARSARHKERCRGV